MDQLTTHRHKVVSIRLAMPIQLLRYPVIFKLESVVLSAAKCGRVVDHMLTDHGVPRSTLEDAVRKVDPKNSLGPKHVVAGFKIVRTGTQISSVELVGKNGQTKTIEVSSGTSETIKRGGGGMTNFIGGLETLLVWLKVVGIADAIPQICTTVVTDNPDNTASRLHRKSPLSVTTIPGKPRDAVIFKVNGETHNFSESSATITGDHSVIRSAADPKALVVVNNAADLTDLDDQFGDAKKIMWMIGSIQLAEFEKTGVVSSVYRSYFARTNILLFNDHEAVRLFQVIAPTKHVPDQLVDVANEILAHLGMETVTITHSKGSVTVGRNLSDPIIVTRTKTIQVKNTTGAGDTLGSALGLGFLIHGKTLVTDPVLYQQFLILGHKLAEMIIMTDDTNLRSMTQTWQETPRTPPQKRPATPLLFPPELDTMLNQHFRLPN